MAEIGKEGNMASGKGGDEMVFTGANRPFGWIRAVIPRGTYST